MQLARVTRDDLFELVLALALVIGLFAFPWFSITVDVGSVSLTARATAVDAPDGWAGVIAAVAALAVVADLGIERLSPSTALPMPGGSREATRFGLAAIAAALVAVKFLLNIHFTWFGWGFYADVVLAGALAYVAHRVRSGLGVLPSWR